MQLYNTALYKDLKKRVSQENWPVVRQALHDTVRALVGYSENNTCGVILTANVGGAFIWDSTPQGHYFWYDIWYHHHTIVF